MATAPDHTAPPTPETGVDLPALNGDADGPVDTHSTRLMLATAAHFVQQHLHSQLAELGLTPLDLSVLSGLAELPGAAVPEIAAQCLLSVSTAERSLSELKQLGFVEDGNGAHTITAAGSRALVDARALEDALFTEKSATLRMELGSLISRLRDGGALDAR